MYEFADRNFSTLSGGEQQRVILARALAQQTPCLILDEPTNHLDITHQLQLMELVRGLNVTVLSAIHDLNIAAMYCDRLYILKDGEIVGSGTPEELDAGDNPTGLPGGVRNCPGSKRENAYFVYGREKIFMKNIGILTCLRAGQVCAGVSCLRAFRAPVFFEKYGADVRLLAFMKCNGCPKDGAAEPRQDPGILKK